MKKQESPCRFVYARANIDIANSIVFQRHITACIALIPHFDENRKFIGIGVGASYRNLRNNPNYAKARKYALERASLAIKNRSTTYFLTSKIHSPFRANQHWHNEEFGGVYVDNKEFVATYDNLVEIVGENVFSYEEITRIKDCIDRMIKKFDN